MINLRSVLGVSGLALCLVLAGCGQAESGSASLEVTSIPQAEVFVDGVSQGLTGSSYQLSPGQHKVEVRLENFTTYETTVTLTADGANKIDTVLMAQDPSDPTVIAKLAESLDIEVAPFVAPRTTRGGRSRSSVATLLWPARDVRKDGLVNYAVEADETYGGDASLEFRHKTKVLYRQSFNPESVTTVRSIPAEVLEHIKIGRTITWGLYFEDRRRPITTKFKIVQRPKADRQLEKLRNSRHMQRQPLVTRQIMAATILENNRLYTESLVSNLKIAAEHPSSTQPYRGIVTTLRRLDGEDSELFGFVSPFVTGRGGRSGVARAGTGARMGSGLSIATWSPIQSGGAPVVADSGNAGAASQAAQGVRPADQGTSAADASAPSAPNGSSEATPVTPTAADVIAPLRARSAEADEASQEATEIAADARAAADTAEAEAKAAEETAVQAEAVAVAAREAVEQAEEPTREQQEAMARAGLAAEEAREAASVARDDVGVAMAAADQADAAAGAAASEATALQTAVNEALSNGTSPAQPGLTQDATDTAQADPALDGEAAALAVTAGEKGVEAADAAVTAAREAVEAAAAARDDDNPVSLQAFEQAQADLARAGEAASQARTDLEAASLALEALAKQVEAGPASNGVPSTAK